MPEIGIKDAAKQKHTTASKIRFWIKTGKLPATLKKIGNSKVERYMIDTKNLRKIPDQAIAEGRTTKRRVTKKTPTRQASIKEIVFNWVQRHPSCLDSIELADLDELIKELEPAAG